MPLQVTPITRQTYRQAAFVLGKAFVDEPVTMAVYRNFSAEQRVRALTADFSAELAVCLRKGYPVQISDEGKLVAAAVIYAPGAFPLPWFDQWKILLQSVLNNGLYDVRSWLVWLGAVDRFHPADAHYYLLYLGVDPPYQGKGYGSYIMEHLLAKADEEEVGCYLENTRRINLSFYQRFGFKVIKEKEIIGFPAWFMWREPSCPHLF